jgi:hypothetical protein
MKLIIDNKEYNFNLSYIAEYLYNESKRKFSYTNDWYNWTNCITVFNR